MPLLQPSPQNSALWTEQASARGNLRQCWHLQGLYQDKPPLPFIPGSEVSGIVTEVGAKVKSVKQGDHVCSLHMSHDQAQSNSFCRACFTTCPAGYAAPARQRSKPGMLQVCAVTRGGAFAEEVCLKEGAVLKLPSGVDIVSAAGAELPPLISGPPLNCTCVG